MEHDLERDYEVGIYLLFKAIEVLTCIEMQRKEDGIQNSEEILVLQGVRARFGELYGIEGF